MGRLTFRIERLPIHLPQRPVVIAQSFARYDQRSVRSQAPQIEVPVQDRERQQRRVGRRLHHERTEQGLRLCTPDVAIRAERRPLVLQVDLSSRLLSRQAARHRIERRTIPRVRRDEVLKVCRRLRRTLDQPGRHAAPAHGLQKGAHVCRPRYVRPRRQRVGRPENFEDLPAQLHVQLERALQVRGLRHAAGQRAHQFGERRAQSLKDAGDLLLERRRHTLSSVFGHACHFTAHDIHPQAASMPPTSLPMVAPLAGTAHWAEPSRRNSYGITTCYTIAYGRVPPCRSLGG